jgi:hypothetical protein
MLVANFDLQIHQPTRLRNKAHVVGFEGTASPVALQKQTRQFETNAVPEGMEMEGISIFEN